MKTTGLSDYDAQRKPYDPCGYPLKKKRKCSICKRRRARGFPGASPGLYMEACIQCFRAIWAGEA